MAWIHAGAEPDRAGGEREASSAIRATAMPDATVLLCDASENYKTREPHLQAEVKRRNLRRFIVMDLLTWPGRP